MSKAEELAKRLDCYLGPDAKQSAVHLRALDASHQRLVEALADCIAAVEVFHGPDAWDIYREHSPEMKRWVAALEQAKELS